MFRRFELAITCKIMPLEYNTVVQTYSSNARSLLILYRKIDNTFRVAHMLVGISEDVRQALMDDVYEVNEELD